MFGIPPVTISLVPAIETPFSGMDRVASWHRDADLIGVLLMLIHPIPIGLDPVRELSLGHGLARGLDSVAMVGLLVPSVWAVAPRPSRSRGARLRPGWPTTYTEWLGAHRLLGPFLIAAVLHGAFVDPIGARSAPLTTLCLITGGIGIAACRYRESLVRHGIHPYDHMVAEATRLDEDTLDVRLSPTGTPLTYRPGQSCPWRSAVPSAGSIIR